MRTLMSVLVLALVACSGDVDGAEDAVRDRIDQMSAGQFDRAYEWVHPDQQAIIDEATYVRCVSASLSGADFAVAEVTDTYESEQVIPGTDTRATINNVTVVIEGGGEVDTQTHPFVMVDDEWRAVIDPTNFEDC